MIPTPLIWLLGWSAIFLLSAAGLSSWTPAAASPSPKPILELRASQLQEKIRLDWDQNSNLIRKAEGATLEVQDGAVFNRYPIEASVLRTGGLDYAHRNKDISLKLTVYQNGKAASQASVRSVAPALVAASNSKPVAVAATRKPSRRAANEGARARRRR